jgi:tetratricopeptide (TPR) repeat protein
MGLGCWYLHVRLPANRWYCPYESGRKFMNEGRFVEAERQFATAVATARLIGDHDHRVALSLFQQAQALVAQARFEEAIPLFEQTLAIDDRALGPDHPEIAPVLECYVVPLRKTGRMAQAEAASNRAHLIHGRLAQPASPIDRSEE